MKRNWEYKKLGDVCDVIMGQSPASDTYNESEGLPFFQGNADFGKEHPEVRVYCNSPIKIALPNDILISVRAPIGAINIADCKCCIGRGLAAIRTGSGVSNRFIYRLLIASRNKLIAQGTGSTFKSIGRSVLAGLSFPVPSLSEQSRIVAELDLLTGIIDKQNAQLKELENLAQAIFYDMFGDPIENPKGWEVKKLGDVCSVVNGLVDPNEEPYCNYPHIGGANIQSNTGVFVDVKLAKDEGLISGKYLFDESMILYSKIRPNLNKVALPSFKGICSADMYPLITNTDIANKYYIKFSITHKKFIEYAVSHSGRANIPKINREALLAYDLPLPPLALQQSFAEKIQSIEKQKEAICASIADTQKLLDYTMDKYFG